MVFQFLLLVTLLACSGIVSGSETALFGLSRLELHTFAASGGRLKRQAWQLMQRPRRVLMTVLIANTAINVLFFAISFVTFEKMSDAHPVAASVGGIAALLAVILFGEILPKAAARARAARMAPLVAPLIRALQTVLGPIRLVLRLSMTEPLTRLLSPADGAGHGRDEVTVEELQALVEMSARQGVIDSAENRMLHHIVALREISVRSIMRPRVDIGAVPIDTPTEDVRAKLQAAKVTRLPVYGQDIDDIRGVVHARDIFLQHDLPLAQLIRPVEFVPEQSNPLQVIEHFRATRTQLAVVVDEYGGVAGLVTLDDLLEEIVGDLASSEKPPEPAVEVIDPNTYRLAGDLDVRDWGRRFGMPGLIDPRFQTVAGLVLARLGRLPREGDSVRIHNLTLTVERLAGRRIDRILLTRQQHGTADRPDDTIRDTEPA
ncbi:MAG TPA: hemolysin family protein [Phycisphaerae bacterium]|nr:hemolysin family protein [Phycisphaerae bacterium]